MKTKLLEKTGVQFITHQTEQYTYLDSARMALEGGCRWVQLRMKGADDKEVEPIAIEIKRMCAAHDALFIIDDRVELAHKVEANGVHLGNNDMPIDQARRILGKEAIIGGTANRFDDVLKHWQRGADYIGCGPFRYTTTKSNLAPILGIEGYLQILKQMKQAAIKLPIVAIGGITCHDIAPLILTGIQGIALSSSILNAQNPTVEMDRVINRVNSIKQSNNQNIV